MPFHNLYDSLREFSITHLADNGSCKISFLNDNKDYTLTILDHEDFSTLIFSISNSKILTVDNSKLRLIDFIEVGPRGNVLPTSESKFIKVFERMTSMKVFL